MNLEPVLGTVPFFSYNSRTDTPLEQMLIFGTVVEDNTALRTRNFSGQRDPSNVGLAVVQTLSGLSTAGGFVALIVAGIQAFFVHDLPEADKTAIIGGSMMGAGAGVYTLVKASK